MSDEVIEKKLQDIIADVVGRSHMALSKTYSGQQAEILDVLGSLRADMEGLRVGQEGIHRRQDIANGRTAKNEERVIGMIAEEARLRDMLENHMKWEEDRFKKEDDNSIWWKRNVGWYVFLAIMGIVFLILKKDGIINI